VLCFLIDVLSPDPAAEYESLKSELEAWSPRLLELSRVVAWTKADLAEPPAGVTFPDASATHVISSVTGRGLDALVNDLWARVREAGGGERRT
jgi:GTPase involved in cell partitioning and DNA repair